MFELEPEPEALVRFPDAIETRVCGSAGRTRQAILHIVELLFESVLRRCNELPVVGLSPDQCALFEATIDAVLETGEPCKVTIHTREVRVTALLQRTLPMIQVVGIEFSC